MRCVEAPRAAGSTQPPGTPTERRAGGHRRARQARLRVLSEAIHFARAPNWAVYGTAVPPVGYPQMPPGVAGRGHVDGANTHWFVVDKPVETVDSHRQLLVLPAPRAAARIAAGAGFDCRALPRKRGCPDSRPLPRPASSPGLGWSGDPGVLPVRHSVERARAATRVVPPLPRGADGAAAGRAGGRSAMERAGWPADG